MQKSLMVFLIAILIVGFALCGSINFSAVQGQISVSGIITSDTIWTKASPYLLIANVLVSNGVTLTIEAGAIVNLNSRYIMVNGTLAANGNSADQIIFNRGKLIFTNFSTGWDEQTGSGSIIDNAFINSTGLTISASPKVSNCLMRHSGIAIDNGSSNISNNNFFAGGIRISGGSPTISGNYLPGWVTAGFEVDIFTPIIVNGGSPMILNNCISIGEIGIEIYQGNPYVFGNNVTGFQPCVRAYSGVLERNYFDGILEIGNVTVKNNTVTSIVVLGSSSPAITSNNIDSMRLSSSTNVDAPNNWWGTTNTALIDQKIWDYNNDYTLGTVTFGPFLTESNAQAMPDPDASVPSPLPSQTPVASPSASLSSSSTLNPTASPAQTDTQTSLQGLYVIIGVLAVVVVVLGVVVVLLVRRKIES